MLSTILELNRSFPSREISPSRRKAEFNHVRHIELLDELCALSLENSNASADRIRKEPPIGAVMVGTSWNIWSLEAIDGIVRRSSANQTKPFLSTDFIESLAARYSKIVGLSYMQTAARAAMPWLCRKKGRKSGKKGGKRQINASRL